MYGKCATYIFSNTSLFSLHDYCKLNFDDSLNLTANHPLGAELQALLQDVLVAKTMQVQKLKIEGDCLVLANILSRRATYLWEYMRHSKKLLDTLEHFQTWQVSFCRRLENADVYASALMAHPALTVCKDFFPPNVAFLYHKDDDN